MAMGRDRSSDHSKWTGIIFMGAAAALFPVKDGFIKALSGSISALEAGLFYFAVQAVVAFMWLGLQFVFNGMQNADTNKINPSLKLSPLLVLRSVFQILAIILFFYSIRHAPLAEAVVLFSSNALFVILFSFLLFRENVQLDVMVTALFGFVGVIIVLGPSVLKLGNVHLLVALLSAMSFAVYLILTKKMGEKYPPGQMLFVDGIFGIFLLSICIILLKGLDAGMSTFLHLGMQDWLYLLSAGLIGTCSALLVIGAMKHTPASLIAPLGYMEIVSAFMIGVVIFKEEIHAFSIIGCLFILASSWRCGWLASKS